MMPEPTSTEGLCNDLVGNKEGDNESSGQEGTVTDGEACSQGPT